MKSFKSLWKMADLRKKLLLTAAVLLIFRLGCNLPIPFIMTGALMPVFEAGNAFNYLNMISGGALSQGSFFALGVTGYINASIVVQLFAYSLSLFDHEDRKEKAEKIKKITMFASLFFYTVLAVGYYVMLKSYNALSDTGIFAAIVIIVSFIAGGMAVVGLGKLIDAKGIGNGISLLVFAGVASRAGTMLFSLIDTLRLAMEGNTLYFLWAILIALFLAASILFVVYVDGSEKRIPVKYAGGVSGRNRYRSHRTYIPFRLIMSGVLPVILASTLLSVPSTIAMFLTPNGPLYNALVGFNEEDFLYLLLYVVLIIAFNYFYISVQYDRKEMANDLRKNGGMILGYRPGKPTSDYISAQMKSLAKTGSFYLAIIALAPIVFFKVTGYSVPFSGTALLIVVGVALEVVKYVKGEIAARYSFF